MMVERFLLVYRIAGRRHRPPNNRPRARDNRNDGSSPANDSIASDAYRSVTAQMERANSSSSVCIRGVTVAEVLRFSDAWIGRMTSGEMRSTLSGIPGDILERIEQRRRRRAKQVGCLAGDDMSVRQPDGSGRASGAFGNGAGGRNRDATVSRMPASSMSSSILRSSSESPLFRKRAHAVPGNSAAGSPAAPLPAQHHHHKWQSRHVHAHIGGAFCRGQTPKIRDIMASSTRKISTSRL